jgi:hypothetical protein
MPLAARITILAGIGALVAGAAYLMIARGPAIMIDLSGSLAQLLCL